MTQLDMQCLTILQAAACADIGLCVKTNDPYKARASLYKFRKDIGDVTLTSLQIRVSPNDSEGEIWILRNQQQANVVINAMDVI